MRIVKCLIYLILYSCFSGSSAYANFSLYGSSSNSGRYSDTINVKQTPLTLSSTQTNVNCFGESTGLINLSVSGGTAPYTYKWNNSARTEDITGLAAGSYTVTVTDSKSLTATTSVTITQPAAALTLDIIQTNVNCFGCNTGAIKLNIKGGTAPYICNWSTEHLTGLKAGNYTITVTDAKGCFATTSVTLTQPAAPPLTLSSTQTNVNCFGSKTGSIDLKVIGGIAPYTYSWISGQSTEDLTSLVAGNYSVTVTDSKGSIATTSIIISQPASALVLSSTQTNVNCFESKTGAIDLSVSGGTAPYTYSWSSGQSTEDVAALAAGSYTVTVTDSKSCTATTSVTITQPSSALALSSSQTNVNCFGSNTGAINLTVIGGTAPYTYSWNNGSGTEDVTSLVAGTYTVTVTDFKGCAATTSVTITQPSSALALSSTQTNVSCFNGSTGAINLSVSGGTAPYTYNWSNGQSTEDLTDLAAGRYTVIVTDSKGCTITKSIIITEPAVALALSSILTQVNHFGESTGAIDLSVNGGTSPYTYSWSSGQSTEDVAALAAGSYTVTVTDSKGCSAVTSVAITQPALSRTEDREAPGLINTALVTAPKDSVSKSITQPALPLILNATQTDLNCFGSRTGSINLGVSGGIAPYTYSWSSGQNTEDIEALGAGSYTVTVTDSKGSSVNKSITIIQPASALALSVIQTNVNCSGSKTGSIDLSVSGGTAPYTYTWNNGESTEDLTALAADKYSVLVTDSKGCTATTFITITQPDVLNVIFSLKNASCKSTSDGSISSLISGGKAPYKVIWNNNPDLNRAELINVKAGSYMILVTDANGCTFTAKTEILHGSCAPLARNDDFNAYDGLTLTADVAVNDTDPNNEKLSFTKLTDPKNGKMMFNKDGKFTFLPDSGFFGKTSFSYQLCNASGLCQIANVTINVSLYSIVNLTPELSSVREGKKVSITARLLRPFKEDVMITVGYSGHAEKEKDYLVLDHYENITIPKGSLSTTQKMTIAALPDGFQEGDEDIIFKVKTVSNSDVLIGNGAVVIINDIFPALTSIDKTHDEHDNRDLVIDPLLSPNGDGNGNDFFNIKNIETYSDNEVLIFNRMGNELFFQKGYNNSDKTFKGYGNKGTLVNSDMPLPDGIYFYVVNTYNVEGGTRVKKINRGYLVLRR